MSEADNVLLPAKWPTDWPISTVGAQFHVILGKMLDSEKNVGTPKPYLGNRSVQWGKVDVANLDLIKLTEGDLRKYRLQAGDLLVCEGGDIGRAAIWQDQLEECYFQKALHRLRPRGTYSSVLMRYLLEYYARTGFLANFATQTSIAHLPKDKFVTVPLPLPPLQEQQAIAAALSDADGVVAGLERVIAKKRLVKQGAMQDLLTARRRLPGFSGEWAVKKLGQLARFGKGKGLPKADVLSAGPFQCIHYGSLFREQPAVISQIQTYAQSFSGAVYSEAGDVLMPTSDVTPSGLAVASCITKSGVVLGGDILVIKPTPGLLVGPFLASAIRNSKAQIMELVSGTTVFHIYAGDMARFALKLPDVVEQQAIAAVLSDMDAEIQTLESRLAKARAVKEGMMQNLLTGRVRLV